MIPIVIGALGTILKDLVRRTGKFRNKRTNGDYPDYGIIKMSWNTKKTPEDLRRLGVPQTPVKDHQLMLV